MNKGSWGKIRAFFDLQTEEGFTIKGFKLVEGINGLFVGFPSQKGSDDEYYDTVWADRDVKEQVNQLAIKTYGQEVIQQYGATLGNWAGAGATVRSVIFNNQGDVFYGEIKIIYKMFPNKSFILMKQE